MLSSKRSEYGNNKWQMNGHCICAGVEIGSPWSLCNWRAGIDIATKKINRHRHSHSGTVIVRWSSLVCSLLCSDLTINAVAVMAAVQSERWFHLSPTCLLFEMCTNALALFLLSPRLMNASWLWIFHHYFTPTNLQTDDVTLCPTQFIWWCRLCYDALLQWAGKTIALGTFPSAEADEKCARAKALTRAWRSTMRPKPSREWVMLELERLQVRTFSLEFRERLPIL